MEWLNNPWFVGIGGGVLSGFIVTWLSRFVLRKRDSREYRQKVSSANRDVVYAVRPGISTFADRSAPFIDDDSEPDFRFFVYGEDAIGARFVRSERQFFA